MTQSKLLAYHGNIILYFLNNLLVSNITGGVFWGLDMAIKIVI